jgi:hypothetical protein
MARAAIALLPNLDITLIAFVLFRLRSGLTARGIRSILGRDSRPRRVALVPARVKVVVASFMQPETVYAPGFRLR